MAFPVVETTNTTDFGSGTSHTINLPASIASGDLLIVWMSVDGGGETITFPNEGSDWIVLFPTTSSGEHTVKSAYRIADGTEGGTITVTTGSNEAGTAISFRISGWSTTDILEASTGNSGTSANPDPDSLTPAGGALDYLWIAWQGCDRNRSTDAFPTNFDDNQINLTGSGVGAASQGIATRNLNTTVQDPGTFTIGGSDQWIAYTIAVYPEDDSSSSSSSSSRSSSSSSSSSSSLSSSSSSSRSSSSRSSRSSTSSRSSSSSSSRSSTS